MIFPTWHWPSHSLTGRASAAFAVFPATKRRPERTAFVRFRRALVVHGLDRSLFAAIARDLETKGACVRKGTSPQSLTAIASLIDATVIGSASKGDKDAAWARHRTRAPAHGYKAHIAADKDSGLIRKVETTPANEADVSIAPAIIPDEPGEVYADRAYDALSVEKAIIAAGGTARLLRKGHRWLPAAADPVAHRKNLRHLETQLSFSSHALARARQGQTPSPSRGHRLQRQALLADASRLSGAARQSKTAKSPVPKVASPARIALRSLT